MKIGFSFGRCVRDIVDGVINIDDVLLIVGRTHMPEREHCEQVVREYLNTHYLRGRDPEQCLQVALALYDTGRVIEPRGQKMHARSVPEDHVWMDLYPTAPVDNAAIADAWQKYRMLLTLTQDPKEQIPEIQEEYLTWK